MEVKGTGPLIREVRWERSRVGDVGTFADVDDEVGGSGTGWDEKRAGVEIDA